MFDLEKQEEELCPTYHFMESQAELESCRSPKAMGKCPVNTTQKARVFVPWRDDGPLRVRPIEFMK